MENENKEFIVATTTNIELACTIRKELKQNFYRLWVCIINDHQVYKVSVANVWGGRLDEETEGAITLFVQKYVDENSDPEPEVELPRVITTINELKKTLAE